MEVNVLERLIDQEIKNGNEGALLMKEELNIIKTNNINDKTSINKMITMLEGFDLYNKKI